MRRLLLAFVVATVAAAAGCQQRAIMPSDLMPERADSTGVVPGYNELVDRYNVNLRGIDRLWASTDVELAWRDEEGDRHFEKGDGKFLFVSPRNVAMTVEKLGKTYVWAGSDEERFWLFERQKDYAYVGRHEHVGKACAEPLPLPVHPSTVPHLLGLLPLERVEGAEPRVQVIEGYPVIEPPGLALRIMLDPATARPVRIDLLDGLGRAVIVSRLRGHRPVRVEGVADDELPGVPESADLVVIGQEARVTLKLDRPTVDPSRIQARAFDFESLVKALKPKRLVELDAGCE